MRVVLGLLILMTASLSQALTLIECRDQGMVYEAAVEGQQAQLRLYQNNDMDLYLSEAEVFHRSYDEEMGTYNLAVMDASENVLMVSIPGMSSESVRAQYAAQGAGAVEYKKGKRFVSELMPCTVFVH